jgi:hypothetical protein
MRRTVPVRAGEPMATIVSALIAIALACCVMQFVPPFDARVDLIKREVAQSAIDKLHASYVDACQELLAYDVAWNSALHHLKTLTDRVDWTAVAEASPAVDVDALEREHERWDRIEMRPVVQRELRCWYAVDAARFLYYPRIFSELTVTPRPNDAYRMLFRSGGLMIGVLYVALGAAFFATGVWIAGLGVGRVPLAGTSEPATPATEAAESDEKKKKNVEVRTDACRFDQCAGIGCACRS